MGKDDCYWTHDGDNWHTDCGMLWKDKHKQWLDIDVLYCPYCGGGLEFTGEGEEVSTSPINYIVKLVTVETGRENKVLD